MGRFVIGYCYYAGRTASNVISSSQLREHLSHRKNEIEPSLTSWDDMDRCLVLPREKAILAPGIVQDPEGDTTAVDVVITAIIAITTPHSHIFSSLALSSSWSLWWRHYSLKGRFFISCGGQSVLSWVRDIVIMKALSNERWWESFSSENPFHCPNSIETNYSSLRIKVASLNSSDGIWFDRSPERTTHTGHNRA